MNIKFLMFLFFASFAFDSFSAQRVVRVNVRGFVSPEVEIFQVKLDAARWLEMFQRGERFGYVISEVGERTRPLLNSNGNRELRKVLDKPAGTTDQQLFNTLRVMHITQNLGH